MSKRFGPVVVPKLKVFDGYADRVLTVREVAERLRVSTATVYKLVEQGALPSVRVSNAIRVRPADLATYLSGEPGGTPE